MKRPFESVREIFSENLKSEKENQRLNFANLDKIMIWINGISLAGLSIIVTNITQFNQNYSHCFIKTILIFLVISIITGIIYRIAFFFFQIRYQQIEAYLSGAFSGKEIMPIEPEDLTNETDINNIITSLRVDFGVDLSFELENYEKANDAEKEVIINKLKKHYKSIGEFVQKEYNITFKFVNDVYSEAFGSSSKISIDKDTVISNAKKFKCLDWITSISLFLSCISFIIAIIILCIEF